MNLLEVYPNFQPGEGGVQRHIYDLCIESIKRNHQPIVLTWSQSAPSTENIDGILVKRIYLPRVFSILRHPMILYLSLYIFYLVKKYKVNVIHAHDYLPGQIAALTGILSGTPTIVTFHLPVQSTTFHLPSYLRSSILIENLFQRFFNFWVSSIICVSKFTYNDAIKIGFPTSKLRVIYNWATFSELAIKSSNSILLEIRNLSGKPYILAVGHLLEKQKRFSLLIQAFNQLLKKGYALTLVIVGDGPDKDTYEKYAASNNIADKILFINNVSDENLIYLYQNCEVFVIPSFLEGMPLVLLEAMCFGKPIVATAFGGVAEAIQNGFNGFLVNHDPRSVSEGIEKIIVDPNLKVIFGERSKQIIYKKFSHKNLNATLLLLEGLSDKNNKKR